MGKKNAAGKSGGSAKMTPAQRAEAAADTKEIIARDEKVAYDYFLEDRLEADLSLIGTEVKALRMGRISLSEAWVEIG